MRMRSDVLLAEVLTMVGIDWRDLEYQQFNRLLDRFTGMLVNKERQCPYCGDY